MRAARIAVHEVRLGEGRDDFLGRRENPLVPEDRDRIILAGAEPMSDWREVVGLIWAYAADVFSTPERATAAFTAVLAISTIGLWWSTRRLWRVTRIAAEHIPHVERAYVSGGARWTSPDFNHLQVCINNYGKTPAFVGTVIIQMIEPDGPVPQKPEYAEKGVFAGYVVQPNVTLQSSFIRPCPADGRLVYGRIYYRDIFNKCHSNGFALRAVSGMPAAQVPDAYWEDREESDLGPAAYERQLSRLRRAWRWMRATG